MEQVFDVLRLSFTRISAVDGASLSDVEVERFRSEARQNLYLSPAEIGCFLSHRESWKIIADGEEEYGVVFEDDMVFGENARMFLSDANWIPPRTKMIKLETADRPTYVDRKDQKLAIGRRLTRLRFNHYCAGGYILSKEAARLLLERSQTLEHAVDEFIFNVISPVFFDLSILQLDPALCIQRRKVPDGQEDELPSSIHERGQYSLMKTSIRPLPKATREFHSAVNKMLTLFGKRERIVVEFK